MAVPRSSEEGRIMLALIDEIARKHIEYMEYMLEQILEEEDVNRCLQRFFATGFAFVAGYFAAARVMISAPYVVAWFVT